VKVLPTIADVAAGAEHCSYNAKLCRSACPVAAATGHESVTPWGINREIAAAARTGVVDAGTAAAVYGCTGCRACGGLCLPGLDLPTHVRAARAAVVEAGFAPDGIDGARGAPAGPDPALAAGSDPAATTIVYPGCHSGDGAALARLLAAADGAYRVVTEPSCCGARSVDVGHASEGLRQAADLDEHLAGAERIVVGDPHCARWLSWDRGDGRVVHLAVYLAQLAARLRFRSGGEVVAWHDPCWLGRGTVQYDAPRAALAAAGGEVAEPEHTREHALCAGAGMGYPHADPAGAARIAARRADELSTGGTTVTVTACPDAAAALRGAGMDAVDLAAWLAGRLEEDEDT
jgi:Fe-S oxidoreductase